MADPKSYGITLPKLPNKPQTGFVKIYNPIDYSKTPARYCGMNITDNPYYNV